MNTINIIDYIDRVDRDDISIHLPPDFISTTSPLANNVILLITHGLSRTGAPIQLMELAKALSELGFQPVLYSLCEGELINNYISIGVPVICGSGPAQSAEWIDELVRDIDLIFINTLPMAPFVRYLAAETRCVFWWIHESSFMFKEKSCADIPLSNNLKILAVSKKCKGNITKYLKRESSILNVCIEDYGMSKDTLSEKIKFLWAGTFDFNKAPEILFEAILQLPKAYLDKSEFIIVGHGHNDNEYATLISSISSKIDNVHLLDAMDHDEFINIISDVDSVVVTSIEETMNTVAIEGFMKGKIVICSDGCGITEFINNDKNGFVFPVRDSKALSDLFKKVIDNYGKLTNLRKAGRMIYENNFTFGIFKENVEKLISNS